MPINLNEGLALDADLQCFVNRLDEENLEVTIPTDFTFYLERSTPRVDDSGESLLFDEVGKSGSYSGNATLRLSKDLFGPEVEPVSGRMQACRCA